MRKEGLLKSFIVVILSILLVVGLSTVAFAADDNSFLDWDTNPINETTTGNTSGTDTTGNTTELDTTGNTLSNTNEQLGNTSLNENSNSELTTNLNTNLDENESENNENVNSLAYTGVESNSILAIAVVLGVIVAVYSFKKVKEYNNL